ncbi:hypothetical protein MSKU3_1189 [Komagataeibacter oboediens]|nr:hypothetical protein MSKU3_1189 [Komagataeibacter oboediens]
MSAVSARRRVATSCAVEVRLSTGLRLIRKRPWFSVTFCPSTPTKEDRLATSASCRIRSASSCWWRFIAVNDVDCAMTEIPWITPVSCTGKNPLGMTTASTPVSTRVTPNMPSVSRWWRSTTSSARP